VPKGGPPVKAIIIGGTVAGIECALSLRASGYDVKIAVYSTYLGEDFTGTWKFFPAEMQSEGKQRLSRLFPEYARSESDILLGGSLKKRLLTLVNQAGIEVLFMTRVLKVDSENNRVRTVHLIDKLGVTQEKCDLLIDATLHHTLTYYLIGKPASVKAGARASIMLEYSGMPCLYPLSSLPGCRLERGCISENHAYLTVSHVSDKDISLEDVRQRLMETACRAAESIGEDERYSSTCLMGAFSPMIDADVPRPAERPFCNLIYPNEITVASLAQIRVPGALSFEPAVLRLSCDVLVIGAGTAGIRAALSAKAENASVILAEFFTALGGTRTVGGVQPPYDGNRNSLFLDMWKSIIRYQKSIRGMQNGKTSAAGEALYYEKRLLSSGIRLIRPAIPTEIARQERRICSVSFLAQDCIYIVDAKEIIDATGDADVARLSGVPTRYGDSELGATQNYSQFHRVSNSQYDTPMADQDVMDLTERTEWSRALKQNTERCAPYDLVEMLTVRESRRIVGRSTVTLSDVYRNRRPADAIYDCMSDYDTHSRCFSEIGRYGVLPSHAPLHFVSVPLGALVPKEYDNLLVCGKAVSADQEAAAHMRMSPDIMCIGHIAGMISARAAKKNLAVTEVPLQEIQKQMHALGALIKLPSEKDEFENTARMIASRLAGGDESAFADALLCNWDSLPALLREIREAGAETKPLLISKVLLYYSDLSCSEEIAKTLRRLNREYGSVRRKDVYKWKIIMGGDTSGRDPYWEINSLVMLICKNKLYEYADIIEEVMRLTCLGETFSLRPLAAVRPDIDVHGNFDRMLTLACGACLMPDERFSGPLVHLYKLCAENPDRTPVFADWWLEVKLLEAAYLCKSKEAIALLSSLTQCPYQVIRKHASKVLASLP